MFRAALLTLILSSNAILAAEEDCGDPFVNGVGPWDYRNADARSDPQKIPVVERYHFAPEVEQLEKGQSLTDLAGDLDYVLRAVPNHHRALYAISRYERQQGRLSAEWRSAECYFERALTFTPDDGVVMMLFGIHWAVRGEHGNAVQSYDNAVKIIPDSAELHYNLGLSLFEIGEYEKSRDAAVKAYAGGYPLQGLRNKLERNGVVWETE